MVLVGVVQIHQDEAFANFGLEGFLIENIGLQLLAPGAPIRAAEFDQQHLVFGFCLGFGGLKIGLPKFVVAARDGGGA